MIYCRTDARLASSLQSFCFTIYTILPGRVFRCKYLVLLLVQTQKGKIKKNVLLSIGKLKKKRKGELIKPIAYDF